MAAKSRKTAKARTAKPKKPARGGAKKSKPSKRGRAPRAGKAWDGGGGVPLTDVIFGDGNNPRTNTQVYLVVATSEPGSGVNVYPAPQLLTVPGAAPLPPSSIPGVSFSNVVGAAVFALQTEGGLSVLGAGQVWNGTSYINSVTANVLVGPDFSMSVGLQS